MIPEGLTKVVLPPGWLGNQIRLNYPGLDWLHEFVGDMDQFQDDQLTTWHLTRKDGREVLLFADPIKAIHFRLACQ